MPFSWKNRYEIHALRNTLSFCIYRKFDTEKIVAFLKRERYECGEEEVQEYLKKYPITKKELRHEKEVQAYINKMFGRK